MSQAHAPVVLLAAAIPRGYCLKFRSEIMSSRSATISRYLFLSLFPVVIHHFLPFSGAQFSFEHCAQYPDDPICRQQQQINDIVQQNMPCHYQARPNPKRLADIDTRQVKIHPPVVKLPGCFTIEIRKVRILEADQADSSGRNIFAKTEFQWLNVAGSRDAKCQNASINGCGGFGNNCYYCDICENLKEINEHTEKADLPAGIAEQFKNMNCPDKAGIYTFRKEFCFNDWSILDTNKLRDCRLDFLDPSTEDDQSGIKSAMAALQQVGYGTIVAKVRLAYNATTEVKQKKAQKEEQIERRTKKELEHRKTNWDPRKGDFADFAQSIIEQRKGNWHKEQYLPWLLYENEIACIRLAFDVCERPPQQRWDGSKGYTCI